MVLAQQQRAEHDAIAAQQRARDVLDRRIAERGGRLGQARRARQAPAPRAVDFVAQRAAVAAQFLAALARDDQRAQPRERIAGREPLRDEFAEALLDLGLEHGGVVREVVEERGAVGAQGVVDFLGARADRRRDIRRG